MYLSGKVVSGGGMPIKLHNYNFAAINKTIKKAHQLNYVLKIKQILIFKEIFKNFVKNIK